MDITEHYKQHLTEHYNLLLEMTKDMQMGELSTSDILKIIELKLDVADKLYRLEKEVRTWQTKTGKSDFSASIKNSKHATTN